MSSVLHVLQAVQRVVKSHVRRLDAALEASLNPRKLAAAAPAGHASTAVTAKLQVGWRWFCCCCRVKAQPAHIKNCFRGRSSRCWAPFRS